MRLTPYGTPVSVNGGDENGSSNAGDGKQYVQVSAADVTTITARMLSELPIHDLTITDPPIESVIERAFQE